MKDLDHSLQRSPVPPCLTSVPLSLSPLPCMPRALRIHWYGYKNQHVPLPSWSLLRRLEQGFFRCRLPPGGEASRNIGRSTPDTFLKGRWYKAAWLARVLSKTSTGCWQVISKVFPLPLIPYDFFRSLEKFI